MAATDGVHRFKATIDAQGENLVIVVPFDVKAAFGTSRPAVWVGIDGHRFQTTISVFESRFYIALRKEQREAAGVIAGQRAEIEIEEDTSLKTVELPPELKAVIRGKKGLLASWKKLSYARRKELAATIFDAKAAAKAERVSAVISLLVSKR